MNYIIPFDPIVFDNINYDLIFDIEKKLSNKEKISRDEVNYYLSVICYITRFNINPNLDNYEYKCDLAQSILYYYLSKYVDVNLCATHKIISKVTGHSFLTAKFNIENEGEVYFLIDPTYIQFFDKENCNLDNYIIINGIVCVTPAPGFFITKENYDYIRIFNNNGFMNLDNKIAQIYGDSFFNTKVGENFTDKLKTMSGDIYFGSFIESTEKPSVPYQNLEENCLLIDNYLKKHIKKVK